MIKKALVVNPFGIGDVVFSLTLVEALKKAFPGVSVGFMGNERTIDLLRMDPHIDACHEFNRDALRVERQKGWPAYWAGWRAHFRELKKEGYDTFFDLSLGREFSFVAFLLDIPKRIGFDYKHRGFFLTHKTPFTGYENKHVVDWQISLLAHLGVDAPAVSARLPLEIAAGDEEKSSRFLQGQGLGPSARFFAVAPGGGRSWGPDAVYKQWAPERFAEAADTWASGSNSSALLLGDAEEAPLLSAVAGRMKAKTVTATSRPLGEVCALLRRAQLLLCNDGGLLHLANALGVRTVSIYGPVDEGTYGPYGSAAPHAVLTQAVPCRPCYRHFHFPPCAHQRRCLEELPTEKVLAALKEIS